MQLWGRRSLVKQVSFGAPQDSWIVYFPDLEEPPSWNKCFNLEYITTSEEARSLVNMQCHRWRVPWTKERGSPLQRGKDVKCFLQGAEGKQPGWPTGTYIRLVRILYSSYKLHDDKLTFLKTTESREIYSGVKVWYTGGTTNTSQEFRNPTRSGFSSRLFLAPDCICTGSPLRQNYCS